MNKYTDSQRLKAIWDGASSDDHPINREMFKLPPPETYSGFLQDIDQCIDAAVKEGYVVGRVITINTVVGNDDLAIINVEKDQ